MAAAIAIGLAVGLLTGGRLQHLEEKRFRAWPLLAGGLVVQTVSGRFGDATVPLVVASYVLLIAFAGVNLHMLGMGVVLVGLVMNFATIAWNGGMPVRRSAIVAAGIRDLEDVDQLEMDKKRHLERPGDDLMFLSDIIPVPGARYVLSFGDLAMSVGVADMVVHLVRPLPGRRRESALQEEDRGAV